MEYQIDKRPVGRPKIRGETRQVVVRMPVDLFRSFEAEAGKKGVTLSAHAVALIEAAMQSGDNK